ncbi:MAG TPA: hypothetical protein VHV78_14415 [Gemmatimonadaceae bacterium]|nr:hypothetical protein [Gemmatimonadaceae bacterium]
METNDTPDDGLGIRDELAIAAKLEGKDDYEAAAIAGYSERTFYRHKQRPAFKRRLAEARHDRVSQIAGQLGNLVDGAIEAIRRSLSIDETSAISLRAAALVLDRYRVFRTELEVADEMAALREELADVRAALERRDASTAEEGEQ